MSWREDLLSNFPANANRLTLAADPDGALTVEGVAAELKRRGYERECRSRWESGEEPCLIASNR